MAGRRPVRRAYVLGLLLALTWATRALAQPAPPSAPTEPNTAAPDAAPAAPPSQPATSAPAAPPAPNPVAPVPAEAANASAAAPPPASPATPGAPSAVAPVPVPSDVPLVPEPLEAVDVEPTAAGDALQIRYLLERVSVKGNQRVKTRMIKSFVPLASGESFDVADPEIEALRYRLLGTGWFDRVDLHLERGRRRGWVVLVIEVEERSTLVFQQLAAGVGWSVEGAGNKAGGEKTSREPEPYLGLAVAETNFLGTGRTLGGEVLVAPEQQGFAIGYYDPVVRASHWSLRTRGSFVNGREYFGGDHDVRVSVACSEVEGKERENCELSPPAAVVDYWRAGLSLGTARDVGSFTRLSLEWHGDFVRVPPGGMPAAASEVRGRGSSELSRAPIDFSIEPYNSHVSMITLGLTYDKRDSAILPTRGTLANFTGDLASGLIASDYEFVRLQTSVNRWTPLPWGHVIRVGMFAGALFGYAPFFYKFFVTDLTDLSPSRILGLNLDHRPAPNLIGLLQCGRPFDASCGTAISQMRQEKLAARIDVEYVWPIVRGRRKFLKNADAFALAGLYTLANPDDLRVALPGYQGLARVPIDLTFDLGVRLDTQAGVFQIGLAKLLWLPVK